MPMENQEVPADNSAWLPLHAEELFAAHVRAEREKRGWTQAKLARQLTLRDVPISQSGVAKLERADSETRRPLRLFEAAAIADLFEMSVDEMIGTLVPDSEEHQRYLEAWTRYQGALAAVVAARRALAEAEEAADLAEVEEAAAAVTMRDAKAAGGDYGKHR